MQRRYKVGTRKSPLALKQVEETLGSLKGLYPEMETEVVAIDTYGDKDKTTPISDMEGSDFFTKEIDNALLNSEIDFAVHSAKDLADKQREGLAIAAITESVDLYDVLVSESGLKLNELPHGAKIGTSSQRRKDALKRFRPDFQILDIRGNIEERLKLLDNNQRPTTKCVAKRSLPEGGDQRQNIDAIVIAAAGLIRLGLRKRITQRIPFEILKPHPLQGALAFVSRTRDFELRKLLLKLDSRENISA